MSAEQRSSRQVQNAFRGFEPIDANYVYCPNQFFDVCLPHHSRGVVRLVAYMLRQTLGFRDENGDPINQDVSLSYGDFVGAGISRGAIRETVDEAINGGFICCSQKGIANSKGTAGQTAHYTLRWAAGNEYVTDPACFPGFYTGDGCRSPIPNAFFDHVAPYETLSVVKVVGAVLRFTVGYENQFGRRDQAPLSYSHLQKFANIKHRPTLAAALRDAQAKGYICCVKQGFFDPTGRDSRAATYAVKWLEMATRKPIGSKTEPVQFEVFNNRTEGGSRTEPVKQFKNRTVEKTKKNTSKQQQGGEVVPSAVAAENIHSYQLLRTKFDEPSAIRLSVIPAADIQQQFDWLQYRNAQRNPLGMLRRAIEENWEAPIIAKSVVRQQPTYEVEQSARIAAVEQEKSKRERRRSSLLAQWQALSPNKQSHVRQLAMDQATTPSQRLLLSRRTDFDSPPTAFLETMALECGLGKSA